MKRAGFGDEGGSGGGGFATAEGGSAAASSVVDKRANITIIGAGAVGLDFAVRLAFGDLANVTIIAKEGSERLRAIQEGDACVIAHPSDTRVPADDSGKHTIRVPVGKIAAVHDAGAIADRQDYVIIAVKAQDITLDFVHKTLKPLIAKNPKIAVVFAQNGIPLWFNHNAQGRVAGRPFECIDEGGRILAAIGPDRVFGMVLNRITNYVTKPGEVTNCSPPPTDGTPQIYIGRPSGHNHPAGDALHALLNKAGIKTEYTHEIRAKIFQKLALNVNGVVAAVAGKSLGGTLSDPQAALVAKLAIDELGDVARKLYRVELGESQRFIDISAGLTHYKPSILVDLEEGKPTEIVPLVGTVIEMRRWITAPSPVLEELAKGVEMLEKRSDGKWSEAEVAALFQRAAVRAVGEESRLPVGVSASGTVDVSVLDPRMLGSILMGYHAAMENGHLGMLFAASSHPPATAVMGGSAVVVGHGMGSAVAVSGMGSAVAVREREYSDDDTAAPPMADGFRSRTGSGAMAAEPRPPSRPPSRPASGGTTSSDSLPSDSEGDAVVERLSPNLAPLIFTVKIDNADKRLRLYWHGRAEDTATVKPRWLTDKLESYMGDDDGGITFSAHTRYVGITGTRPGKPQELVERWAAAAGVTCTVEAKAAAMARK